MRDRSLSNAWIGGLALLAICSCTDDVSVPGSSVAPTSTLAFRPCDIATTNGNLVRAAECAEVEVPARRGVPSSRPVTLSLKRYKRAAEPRGQLWLIAGGPGSAASDFEVDAEFYLGLGHDLELYFLDHRGTGRSTRLACPNEEDPTSPSGQLVRDAEWPSCAASLEQAWGDDLAGFNVTEAAADLGEAIAQIRRANEPVFLYSVSYGTYLAQRYLQLYPEQPTGVILDSICAPGKCDLLLEFDRQFDTTTRAIFGYCAAEPHCARELGSDPFSHVTSLAAALAEGHCAKLGWTNVTLRQVLGFMVGIARLRDYMPAVVERAERCTDSDVAALSQFQRFVGGIDTEPVSMSQALWAHIAISELSGRPLPTADDIANNVANLYASVDAGPRLAPAISRWPRYVRDVYFGAFADTRVPLLMLNGTLDPQTPLAVARPAGDFYLRPNQHFVEIPYSPHTTLTQSLIDDAGNTCGAELARQFFDDPTAALDTACLELVEPLNFDGFADITQLLFGTSSPWADTP